MSYLLKFKTILEIKRYSANTVESYVNSVKNFGLHYEYSATQIEKLEDKDVILSVINLVKNKSYSISSQKQLIGGLKLFYKEVFRREIDFSIIYPTRNTEYLAVILSKEEITSIIKSIENKKHKTIIAVIYGLGLRISEAVNLEVFDIDSNRMLVHIKNAKGKKDRMVMLPNNLLMMLREYFKIYKPQKYLFEGLKGAKYSDTSIRKILKKAADSVNINKKITVHTLRHSFATHLLENGTDIRIIQKLLGHKSINTTLQYVKVAQSTIQNVKSPIDYIEI